jgi:hypothetical protein
MFIQNLADSKKEFQSFVIRLTNEIGKDKVATFFLEHSGQPLDPLLTKCVADSSNSTPQSQRHNHTIYVALRFDVGETPTILPYLTPVWSLEFVAITPPFA